MTDYVNAYAIPALKIRGSDDDSPQPTLDSFLFATDQYDYRKKSSKTRAAVVRKYQTNIAAAVRKLLEAKKRPKSVLALMERFPEALSTLESADAVLLDEFMLIAASILKNPVQIALFEGGVLRTPIEETADTPIMLLTLDTPKRHPALVYMDGDPATYIFPFDHPTIQLLHNLDNMVRVDRESATESAQPEETLENVAEAQLYHLDDLQFDPFDDDLEMDRALPPPPANMERSHLLADMLKLLPENPDIDSYARILLRSLNPPPPTPVFLNPFKPLVRIDPFEQLPNDPREAMAMGKELSMEYVERMKDFAKATKRARPYVESVYTQQEEIKGLGLFPPSASFERRDVFLDNFDAKIRDESWMDMIDVEYCHKRLSREVLEKYAAVYNVKVVGNKRRLCELMEPYLKNIVQVTSQKDTCETNMGEEDLSQMPLMEESDGKVLPYYSAGVLKEEEIRSQGILYEGDPERPYDVMRFDMDRYEEHVQRISNALPVRCELKHFAPEGGIEPPLSEEGEVLELVDGTFLRIRTDGRETFFNLGNIRANTFFLYTVSYNGERFHKRDLGHRNVLFRSTKLPADELRRAMGLSFEQYMYIRRKGGFADTPLQHDFETTAGISHALRELFDIDGINDLTRSQFEEIRKEIESADILPPTKTRKIAAEPSPEVSARSFPLLANIVDELRERPILTNGTVQERLGALLAHSDYPLHLCKKIQRADLLRGPPPDYILPSFETPRMDPPGTILHFESMEALRAHRLELEPVLQHRAEVNLRKNAAAVRSSFDSLEEIHATQIELMLQIDLFGILSRRSRVAEMQSDQTRARQLVGDLKEADVFTTAGDQQIEYVAPLIQPKSSDEITLTDTLVDLLRIPMNDADRRRIELDHAPYKVLLTNLFAAQKGSRPGAPSARLEQYTEVCARCSLISIYLMGKRELFPLIPRHAAHFSFDGFPVQNTSNGVSKYIAHVISEAYPANAMFDKPEAVEKTIRGAINYFLRKYPNVLPMLKRRATEARDRASTVRAEPVYKPLPRSSIVERVKKETEAGVVRKDFRMHPRRGSSQKRSFLYPALVSAVTSWDRHVPLEKGKRLRHRKVIQVEPKKSTSSTEERAENVDKALTELVEQVGDWVDLEELLRVAIRTSRNANFHRVNVNLELNQLGFSFDHAHDFLNSAASRSIFERRAVKNDPSQGAAHNTLLMLRGMRDLLTDLFQEDMPEGVSPFAIRHHLKNISKQEAYNALQRAFAKGVRRLIQEIEFNTVDESKLREHSDLLRDADKQHALDQYADMDVDSRMVVKLVKDMVGIQPSSMEADRIEREEGDMSKEHDFRFVPAEDDDQID